MLTIGSPVFPLRIRELYSFFRFVNKIRRNTTMKYVDKNHTTETNMLYARFIFF